MKAIILSYDKRVGLCELVYKTYMEKWIDCPLEFWIPWNKEKPVSFEGKPNVKLINCGSDVRPTLKALLEGISDEEWVYWCIDDRYPLRVSDSQTLTQIHDYLVDNPSACSDYDAVRILRWREKTPKQHTAKNAIIAEQQFFEVRGGPGTGGLWHHQFCKAKFLKKFLNMDEKSGWQYLNEIKKSKTHKEMRILVPQKSLVSFVETCWQGKLLYQAGLDLKKYECQIPDLPKTPGNKSRIFTHRGEGPWFDKNHPDLNRWLENKNGN